MPRTIKLNDTHRALIRGKDEARYEITIRGIFPFIDGLIFEQAWFQPGDTLIILGAHPEEKNTWRVLFEPRMPFSTCVP